MHVGKQHNSLVIVFNEGEHKRNFVFASCVFELVCLCTVMQNESSRNACADARLIFAGASLGREAGTMRSQKTVFGLKRVRKVKALQGYHPGKESFSQPPNIVKGVQIE